jgi:hypothetical protein
MKNIFIIIETLVNLILISLILSHLVGFVWSNEEIFKSQQPKELNYNTYDPYSLRIIKQKRTLGSEYIIMVSKYVEPGYGHVLNYPEPYVISEDELKKVIVKWSSTGIELQLTMGHKLFIPKNAFIGGR